MSKTTASASTAERLATAGGIRAPGAAGRPESPLLALFGLMDFTAVPVKGHAVIKRGVSSKVIEPVSKYLGLGKGALADFMDLDRSTATRLVSKGHQLPAHAAETLLRLLELHDMARDIFATDADAAAWLSTAHPLLDDETPLDAARTSYGAHSVKNLLMAIKYGGAV